MTARVLIQVLLYYIVLLIIFSNAEELGTLKLEQPLSNIEPIS
jgi:hypothetical protein